MIGGLWLTCIMTSVFFVILVSIVLWLLAALFFIIPKYKPEITNYASTPNTSQRGELSGLLHYQRNNRPISS